MSGIWAIYRREMLSLWVTPLAWVLLFCFLLLQGSIFYSIVTHFGSHGVEAAEVGPIEAYFGGQSIFLMMTLLLLCPGLSMRTFAEERRSGTIEMLLTAPATAAAIVLGKYLATFTTYVTIWAPTLLYVLILRDTGHVDWPVVAASYAGLFAVGAAFLAVGLLASSVTESQLVALMLAVLVQFGLFVLGVGEHIFEPGLLSEICAHVSILSQMEEFSRGIIDLRRLVFDGSLIVLSLFVTVLVVDSWRWR